MGPSGSQRGATAVLTRAGGGRRVGAVGAALGLHQHQRVLRARLRASVYRQPRLSQGTNTQTASK